MNDVEVDETVASLVANLIYQVNGVLPNRVRPGDSLITDLGMDSVELIDLLMRLEEIGVTIPESDISPSLTVEDIIQRCSNARSAVLSPSSDRGEGDNPVKRRLHNDYHAGADS